MSFRPFSPYGAPVERTKAETGSRQNVISDSGATTVLNMVPDRGATSVNHAVSDSGATTALKMVFDRGATSVNHAVLDSGVTSLPNMFSG